MKLPKLRAGDQLYAHRRGQPTEILTITSVDRDRFFCTWPNGRPEGVSRRQLREYGEAYGSNLATITVDPSGAVVAMTPEYTGPVVVHGGRQ